MAHEIIQIEDIDINLIYDSTFCHYDKSLDFLQGIRRIDQIKKIQKEPDYQSFINRISTLEKSYKEYIPQAINNLLREFQKSYASFIPDAVITPLTSRKYLQEPLLEAFQKKFPNMMNLSKYLKRNPGGTGTDKFQKVEDVADIFNEIKRILILDDVYATGETVKSIILNLGKKQSFIVVCPLYVKQDIHKEVAVDQGIEAWKKSKMSSSQ